ncbi:MAG: hypothetical protein Q7T96_17375 [Methylobacter sp.]|uniref:hypothetical protein n=1 Tax=Methylobacter sp. TaxID=2051955 RepID=UPI00272299D3|nr:hypothetical protein [Methylobacter sp.]MDO9270877.1 hypothetical protein [Methylobacter sp.]MDP1665008.1 hypothetical protein [Methylobacter sp.]
MNNILQVFFKSKFIILASITLSGCPLTVNLNVSTDKPISIALDKPVEVKLGADIAVTELPPIKITTLPPVRVGIAPATKK